MFGEGFWPAIGLLLVLLWLGSAVAGNTVHRVWAARLGSLAFVGHAMYLGSTMWVGGIEWIAVAMTAALVGGLVYGGSLIALPMLAAAYGGTLGRAVSGLRSWKAAQRQAADDRRRKREQEEYQRRSREEYERAAPERERQRQEEERRKAAAAQDARRRRDARAACELAYSRCAVEIGDRFSRQELERFMGTYMGDDHAAEDVERRGEELCKVMADYRQPDKPEKKKRTMQDLAEWYLREKQAIESLPLEEFVRLEHVAALDMRYAELTQELLQRIEP
jgi:hypothetical protein